MTHTKELLVSGVMAKIKVKKFYIAVMPNGTEMTIENPELITDESMMIEGDVYENEVNNYPESRSIQIYESFKIKP